MFGKIPEAIIYLSRNGLQVFLPEEEKTFQLPFPAKTIVNLEVVSAESLSAQISDFFEENQIKSQSAMVMLSDDMLFTKKIAARTPEARDSLVKEFLHNIPLDPKLVVHKVFTFRGYRLAVATNKNVFMTVKNILEGLKWKILYIVPDVIFVRGNLAPQKIMDVLEDRELLRMGNFLSLKPPKQTSIEPKKKIPLHLFIPSAVLATGFLVFVFLVLFGVIDFNKEESWVPDFKDVNLVEGTAPSIEEPLPAQAGAEAESPSDSEAALSKVGFAVQVLNGTGVSGLASSTKADLEEIGFENIEIDNADSQDYAETEVVYKSSVPQSVIDDIVGILEESFETVVAKTAQVELDYDIIITTGSLK